MRSRFPLAVGLDGRLSFLKYARKDRDSKKNIFLERKDLAR